MKIVCSSSVVFAEEAFGSLGEVHLLPPRDIDRTHVQDADLLVTRSTTPIHEDLLGGSKVQFVGTATIGTDHMDIPYLEQAGIQWTYAPGCNANSVGEYVSSALLCLANRHDLSLEGKTLGIVGAGNVGTRVARVAKALGLRVLLCDPPRARAEGGVSLQDDDTFHPLQTLMEASDILTLHVPLSREGEDPTFHLAGTAFFEGMKPGCILINAARGKIVDTEALLAAMESGTVAHAVIDTWENEPAYSQALLDRVDLGTPHIAGYSFDGLVNGTLSVYNDACRCFGVAPTWLPDDLMPAPDHPDIPLVTTAQRVETDLWEVVRQAYDIEADDRQLRAHPAEGNRERGIDFDQQRKNYPVRREFTASTVHLQPDAVRQESTLSGLGFSCVRELQG
jgi:erythronate-4-phosphate dehydrogenase